jgi:hypothetical protein
MLFVLVVGTDVCNKSEAFFGNCFRNMCLTFAKTRFYGFRSRSEFSLLILEVSFSVNILVEKMTLLSVFSNFRMFSRSRPFARGWVRWVARGGCAGTPLTPRPPYAHVTCTYVVNKSFG